MLIWGNLCSLFTDLCSLTSVTHQHRAICKSPLQQSAKTLMLIWGNLCSLFSALCSLTSDLCSPLTDLCSLTSVHYSFTGIIPVILWAFRWVNRLSKSIPIPLVIEPCRLSIYSKGCSVNTQSVLACQKSSEVLSTLPS